MPDCRGHGRSDQTWDHIDMNYCTDDLHELLEHLDLKDVMLVGHSTGGGDVARYCGRHGTKRVAKAVLISAIPPLMLQTDANPGRLPMLVFDGFRVGMDKDHAHFFIDIPTGPFLGFNRPRAKVSQGMIWIWWQQGTTANYMWAYDCDTVFSETDSMEDLKGMEIPVLLLYGHDHQIVLIDASARSRIKLTPHGRLKEYPGDAHALPNLNSQEINKDLLDF